MNDKLMLTNLFITSIAATYMFNHTIQNIYRKQTIGATRIYIICVLNVREFCAAVVAAAVRKFSTFLGRNFCGKFGGKLAHKTSAKINPR